MDDYKSMSTDLKKLENTADSKKRNLSDVSQASISPSPAIKIAHTVNKSTVDDMDTMEQLTNMCSDGKDETDASLHTKLDMVIHLLQEMKNDFDSQKIQLLKR